MPWGRIDDAFYDHPKLDALGSSRLPCIGLHMLAISWSNRYLTDGFIPVGRVTRLGGTPALADRLVDAGLWEAAGEDYRIHDFLQFNPSRERVHERQAYFREIGHRGGRATAEARRSSATLDLNGAPRPVLDHTLPIDRADEAQRRFDEGVRRTQREQRRIRGEDA